MKELKEILENLKEEWVTGIETYGDKGNEFGRFIDRDKEEGVFNVYKNPSKKEIGKCAGENNAIRFIALKDEEEFYIWNATYGIHDQVRRELGLENVSEDNKFEGTAFWERGELDFDYGIFDTRPQYYKMEDEFLDGEWDWLSRYKFYVDGIKDYLERG